jgi:2',3'-cyclic-nucleotide 2'-phosphodiesterase (5'-nucleotidase family)
MKLSITLVAFFSVVAAEEDIARRKGGKGKGYYYPAPAPAPAPSGRWLQILHSSDNESSFQDPNTLEEKVIFYSALVNGLQTQKDVCDDREFETVHVTVGDHTIPGPFYQASAEVPSFGAPGVGDIRIYNAMGVAANGMGNHEFDGGIGKSIFKCPTRRGRIH